MRSYAIGSSTCRQRGEAPDDTAAKSRRARVRLRGLVSTAVLAGAAALAGCSGAGLDAESACRDFLNAPLDEQNALVSDIAADVGAANAVTPLGRPNVDYLCVQNPDMTVGEAVERTG